MTRVGRAGGDPLSHGLCGHLVRVHTRPQRALLGAQWLSLDGSSGPGLLRPNPNDKGRLSVEGGVATRPPAEDDAWNEVKPWDELTWESGSCADRRSGCRRGARESNARRNSARTSSSPPASSSVAPRRRCAARVTASLREQLPIVHRGASPPRATDLRRKHVGSGSERHADSYERVLHSPPNRRT